MRLTMATPGSPPENGAASTLSPAEVETKSLLLPHTFNEFGTKNTSKPPKKGTEQPYDELQKE
ncbi:hypothetical protein [Nocardiopsis alba]|uniref:hypothetical protein n=1 Tax=Nocardiopsis alba TaxID=53437 RepID=UPI00126919BD|nr:hypothetical protein [Nocardiopsis alba]